MSPVLSDLGDVAPDINRLLLELGPFSKAAIPAVESLGEAAKIGTPAVRDARPVISDLRAFAKAARPVGSTAAALLESFRKTRGVERAMDYIFYQVAAVNGFDSFGHYLRARLILNTCSTYNTAPVEGCEAKFEPTKLQAGESAASSATSDPILARTRAALAGMDPDRAAPPLPQHAPRTETTAPTAKRPAPASAAPVPRRQPAAAAPDSAEPLMDYLFGKDAP
jgi:phospholipid/cholesterol/gamma-HCH transport system substrate-binding protein